MKRRVAITGVGLVSALGLGTHQNWKALVAGECGIKPITRFDTEQFSVKIAGEVKGFDPLDWISKKDVKKMDPFIQYAVAAAQYAMENSSLKINGEQARRFGVHIGSGIGGFSTIEREHTELIKGGPKRISPFFIPSSIVNLAAGHISIRFGAKGPNTATCTACSSGSHAIGDSFRIIARGEADAMLCGGSEAAITPMSVGGFASMRALSTRNEEPERASRPFDRDRDGFVIGEGAGILVLEDMEMAKLRGATVYAEIVGYGMSGDAFHITQPSENAEGACQVMINALTDAGIRPEQVDYINAHGTSTPFNDRLETMAVKRVFGKHAYHLTMSSTKSMTGHLLGAAGGLEGGVSVLALHHQMVPPTINYEIPDPDCDLDYVPNQVQKRKLDYVLSNSFGFGGTNAALLFRRYQE